LNFPNCTINKTSSQKFILKNLSGIKTSFVFDVRNYAPTHQVAPKEKSELEKAKEEAERRAKQAEEDELNGTKHSKPGKKVGFAATSGGFGSTGAGAGSDVF
jgi:hypothetical protein